MNCIHNEQSTSVLYAAQTACVLAYASVAHTARWIPLEQQFVKVPAMMEELLDEAETQFRARYYIQRVMFEDQTITEIKAYALCFCRKRCAVRLVEE